MKFLKSVLFYIALAVGGALIIAWVFMKPKRDKKHGSKLNEAIKKIDALDSDIESFLRLNKPYK